jgi:uncharacterized lipoprotein YddW (UPF0748 family)
MRDIARGCTMAGLAALAVLATGCTLATTPIEAPGPPSDLPPPSSERPRPEPVPPGAALPTGAAPMSGIADRGSVAEARRLGSALRTVRAGETHPLPAALPDEVRALWVVRTSLQHPDAVRDVVARAAAGGFNTLLVQVRGRGDAWYRSSIEPRAMQLDRMPGDFDPLALLLELARPRGLQVHAWVNVHLVASHELLPTDPRHVVHAHRDWLALPLELARQLQGVDPRDPNYLDALVRWTRANAEQVEGIYTSPGNPAVRAHVTRVVEELARGYDLDGIHLDYVRHPSARFDYSPGALDAFEAWLRARPVVGPARVASARAGLGGGVGGGEGGPDALPAAFPVEWTAFRRYQVGLLVEDVAAVLGRVDPGLLLSAAVFPDLVAAREERLQGWDEWLRSGVVDVVVPMIYTARDDTFARQLEGAIAVGGPRRVWAGLGIYRDTFSGAVSKGRIARSAEAGGLALFSYDWAVGPEGSMAADAGPGGYLVRWSREGWGVR